MVSYPDSTVVKFNMAASKDDIIRELRIKLANNDLELAKIKEILAKKVDFVA